MLFVLFKCKYRDAQRRERQRQLELASAGEKALRSRVQNKRGRAKEMLIGAKKHEEAMKEMARRKAENNSRKQPAAGAGTTHKIGISAAAQNMSKQQQQNRVVLPSKGISANVRNKNKHLQEFENMKQNYRKRKGKLRQY